MIPTYQTLPARDQAPMPGVPFHHWEMPAGELWAEFHRVPGAILVRFPGLADFAIPSEGGQVACWPAPGVSQATWDHLYINQVLPLTLGRQDGRLTFHASGVVVRTGAIAFFGQSGLGKSTLAGGFVAWGARFLTDDCLIVAQRDGRYLIEPGHPSLRLWDDSREALAAVNAPLAETIDYTPKSKLLFAETLCAEPQPFAAAYFLGEAESQFVRFTRLDGADAVNAWLRNAYILDPEDRSELARHFAALARLCSSVRAFTIEYPRSYTKLQSVVQTIAQHAEGGNDET